MAESFYWRNFWYQVDNLHSFLSIFFKAETYIIAWPFIYVLFYVRLYNLF